VEADEELHALLERAAKLMVKAGDRSCAVNVKVAGKEKMYGSWSPASTWTGSNVENRRRSERHPPLASRAPHQPRPARDAPDALECGGVGSGPRRVQEGAQRRHEQPAALISHRLSSPSGQTASRVFTVFR
jgi:hypothetical protein